MLAVIISAYTKLQFIGKTEMIKKIHLSTGRRRRGAVATLRLYWPLIKSLQTGLLLSTGIAGYLSSRPPFSISLLLGLAASLFLAISGSTIMNMWYDRDIDALMNLLVKHADHAVADADAVRNPEISGQRI